MVQQVCPSCGLIFPISDFYGRSKCYKCVFKEKSSKQEEKTTSRRCIICKKDIPQERTRYCCKECQKLGDDIRNKKVWWKKITIVKITKFNSWS